MSETKNNGTPVPEKKAKSASAESAKAAAKAAAKPVKKAGTEARSPEAAGHTPSPAEEPKPYEGQAIGMLETRGLVGALDASDAMLKAADVTLVGSEKIGSGLVSIVIRGDVAAVEAALDVGKGVAAELGEIYAVHVIPHPHNDVEKILPTHK